MTQDESGGLRATVRHKVGKCPACRDYVWADVDLETITTPPRLDDDGTPKVYARAEAVGMRVTHECRKGADEPAEAPRSDSGGFQRVSGHPDGSQALHGASSVQPMPSPYGQPCGPCRFDDHHACTIVTCPCNCALAAPDPHPGDERTGSGL